VLLVQNRIFLHDYRYYGNMHINFLSYVLLHNQVLSERLADSMAISGDGSGIEGGDVVQELSGLQSALDGLKSLFMTVNSTLSNVDSQTDELISNATAISR